MHEQDDMENDKEMQSRSQEFLKQLKSILIETLLTMPVEVIENEMMPFIGPEGFFIFEKDCCTLQDPIPVRFSVVANDKHKWFIDGLEPALKPPWSGCAMQMLNFIQAPNQNGTPLSTIIQLNQSFFVSNQESVFQNGERLRGQGVLHQLYFIESNISRDTLYCDTTIACIFDEKHSVAIVNTQFTHLIKVKIF